MKILFLTNNSNTQPLIDWLRNDQKEDVDVYAKKINKIVIKKYKPEFIISYNYKYLISKEIVDLFQSKIINLHISFLPWNRGANPNIWSFIDNTKKGVTIHQIDSGIDTGPLLLQEEISFDENKETLFSSYNLLHNQIQELFKKNWKNIKNNRLSFIAQKGKGSMHTLGDYAKISSLIKDNWNISIKDFKQIFGQKHDEL